MLVIYLVKIFGKIRFCSDFSCRNYQGEAGLVAFSLFKVYLRLQFVPHRIHLRARIF